jgi:glyoxylase-like metal-dependent hydrolase (beta-lactamase superfamily II)
MSLEIVPFYEQQSSTWTYLVADAAAGEAVVIDPVWVYDPVSGQADTSFIDRVLARSRDAGWRLRWVLETHAHADHLSAAGVVSDATGAEVAIGRGICAVQENFARIYHLPELPRDGRQFDRLLQEGDEIDFGGERIRVMETPGHTSDSLTYVVGDAAFIGDTLFSPGYGSARCDFPGGDAGLLFDSVQRLYALPPETRLFLCHDYPAPDQEPRCMVTVEESRRNNRHINADTDRAAFVAMRTERDAGLSLPQLILPSLQVNIIGGRAPAPEGNGCSYLKIPFDTTIADLLAEPSE